MKYVVLRNPFFIITINQSYSSLILFKENEVGVTSEIKMNRFILHFTRLALLSGQYHYLSLSHIYPVEISSL